MHDATFLIEDAWLWYCCDVQGTWFGLCRSKEKRDYLIIIMMYGSYGYILFCWSNMLLKWLSCSMEYHKLNKFVEKGHLVIILHGTTDKRRCKVLKDYRGIYVQLWKEYENCWFSLGFIGCYRSKTKWFDVEHACYMN